MKYVIVLLALSATCLADEVVCKDGRKIEFKTLEDTGETYTITTPEGARVVVKRADVDGFAKTEPVVALTGAAMSFDKKSKTDTVDLLKKVELEKDVQTGVWKFGPGGVLTGSTGTSGDPTARLQIRHIPTSDEYNLTMVLERTDGGDNIGIGFPTPGGGLAMWHLDVDMGSYQGLLVPDGADHKKLAAVPGKQLTPGKPRTLTLMVRKAALVVQLDGRDVSTYRADWSKIAPLPQCLPSQPGFALFVLKSGIRISRATVTTVQAGAK